MIINDYKDGQFKLDSWQVLSVLQQETGEKYLDIRGRQRDEIEKNFIKKQIHIVGVMKNGGVKTAKNDNGKDS